MPDRRIPSGDPHGQDQAPLHRNRDRHRRAQRSHRNERRLGEGRSLGAEGDGRPGEAGHGDAGASLRRRLRGLLRRRARLRRQAAEEGCREGEDHLRRVHRPARGRGLRPLGQAHRGRQEPAAGRARRARPRSARADLPVLARDAEQRRRGARRFRRVAVKRGVDHILTTHVGSLPRPKDLLDLMKAKLAGGAVDRGAYDARVASAVAECVRKQVESGIDFVSDGEQSKPGFFTYVRERLEGFEERPQQKRRMFPDEVAAFPEYYEKYFKEAMTGGAIAPIVPLVCIGPVKYRGEAALERDIANLKAAAGGAHGAFMPAVAPSGVGTNEYYRIEEEFFHAVGAALHAEYKAIVDAELLLQVDDPFLCDIFGDSALGAARQRARAEMYVEAINESLRDILPEKVRYHTCYGINEGPRIHEAALSDVVGYMLKVNAGAYSFEAANPRHEHEYHLWESVRLPEGKVLIPGVITHASNIVEHPVLIAERLVRFAKLVGRENVIAGADCGFSSQATYHTEVHPTVVWAKFEALRDGARLASKQLWS